MIKINLAKKKQAAFVSGEDAPQGLVDSLKRMKFDTADLQEMPVLQMVGVLCAWIAASVALSAVESKEIETVEIEIKSIRAEQSRLQAQAAKTKDYEKIKTQIEADEVKMKTKINTIKTLVAGRKEATSTLYVLSDSVPDDVWLDKFQILANKVAIEGRAVGYNLVSDFMKRLSESTTFTQLKLQSTEQTKDRATGLELANFKLTATKVTGVVR